MLSSMSKAPTHLLGLTAKRDDAKTHLPSKRKRESICGLGSFNEPFTIKPSPGSPYEKPATLKPVRIIGRSQLPLGFLDASAIDDSFAANRLFSAYISVLEEYHGSQDKADEVPRVLIARHETKRALYAIERVRAQVYSIYKLASWLKEKDVLYLWDPSSLKLYPAVPKIPKPEDYEAGWWQEAIMETAPDEQSVKHAKVSMLRPKVQLNPAPAQAGSPGRINGDKNKTLLEPTNFASAVTDMPELSMKPPSPQEQLETLVQQYLDSIYLSKMSLAYFAKGPITRIRNSFTSPEEGAPQTCDLVQFLRSMLLSHKSSDKKYHSRLPDIIKTIPLGTQSDDEQAERVPKPRKNKKKIKLSRDGVYPQEEDIVKKWWNLESESMGTYNEETLDQRIKRRVGELRVRETLAQMIIMLEITALEALSTYKPLEEVQNDVEKTQNRDESQAKPKKRKKKLDDIGLQLDLLLDKLLIWQTTDAVGILDFDSKPSKQGDSGANSGGRGSNDRLQSFCVEVIIPFYMNRLPDQAIMINEKLGGPIHIPPPKRKGMNPLATSRQSDDTREPEKKKSRRAVERVATDTTGKTGQKAAPSFSRSTTDSALLNGIKREGSEVPLSAIPFQRSPSAASRQSMSQFKHMKGREIDLTTPTAAAEAKMKQKKRVEEDLKDAISALKKPNRGLVAGSYADDVEQRGLGLGNKSRKPTSTVRKVAQDIQVSATPRLGKRTKSLVEQTPVHRRDPFFRSHATDGPSSSDFCIPSSGLRPTSSIVPGTDHRSVTARNLPGSSVTETPCKAPNTKTFNSGTARKTIFETPTKRGAPLPESSIQGDVLGTPVQSKRASLPAAVSATPSKAAAAPMNGTKLPKPPVPDNDEPSIYGALGWNDDDDLL